MYVSAEYKGMTYNETMEHALLAARQELENTSDNDSYIDLETSIHNTPVASIQLNKSLTDELNASKNFEAYLELAVKDELGDGSPLAPQLGDDRCSRPQSLTETEYPNAVPLAELIKQEAEKSQAFEDMLRAALDE